MFKPISTSFSPNFERDDTVRALRLLLNLADKKKLASSSKLFKHDFSNYLGITNVSLFSSGRSALMYALKSLGLKDGSGVLLQAFTCVAVVNAVRWAGLRPIFVDVDPKTYNMSVEDFKKKLHKNTRAVILQHTFGIPGKVSEIQQLSKSNNLLVVQDCAHALGVTLKGVELGSFGDVSIFSFGRDKMLSCVFGGAAITDNQDIAKRLAAYESSLSLPNPLFVKRALLYPLIYSISLSVYTAFAGRLLLWLSARLGLLLPAVYNCEKKGNKPPFIQYSLSNELSFMLYHQFRKINRYTHHRRMISDLYISSLGLKLKSAPYLRVPVRVRQKKSFLQEAKKHNIHLGNWYRGPIDPGLAHLSAFGYQTCTVAEDLSKKTINLPTHVNMTKKSAKKIIQFLKNHPKEWLV